MLNRVIFTIVALALTIGVSAQASAQNRYALVVANSNYRTVTALDNPVRDADAVSALLREAGFEVIMATDLEQTEMRRTLREFASNMADKPENSTTLIYFAGHGVQIDGENYLLPVDAKVTRESDVALEGIRLAVVMNMLDTIPSRTRIVILDACRNNPFDEIANRTGRGLALVNAPAGTLVAYSTSPGSVAEDGTGANSPFAQQLIRAARQPGAPIETVFQNVRLSVHKSTEGRQTPWEVTALTEPFLFFPGTVNAKYETEGGKSESEWRKQLRSRSPEGAYDLVVLQDNVIVYQVFLTLYADTPWGIRIRGIMERRIEMLAWFDAVRLNSAEAFAAFLDRYPNSDLAPTAKRLKNRAEKLSLVASRTPGALDLADNAKVRTVVKEVRVPVVKEVIKEVRVPVVKEVIKEVRVPVVKEVIKTVRVPVVKEVIKTVRVPIVKEVVKTVRVPVPCHCRRPHKPGPSFNPGPRFSPPSRFRDRPQFRPQFRQQFRSHRRR